ncbi:MAG: outer membrane protein assembly factor BamD [Bdellovibrionales bacterium]|nr:outer membrane protein assembly factor BamD [Bdellovibrionales bacterium]
MSLIRYTKAALLGAGLSLLISCSSAPITENDPGQMFKEAEEEIQNDHYILAVERLKSIKNKFPYSQFAPLAQLRLADVFFLQETFAEAASAYEAFRDLYPKHEKTPYALFRTAKSYFKDSPSQIARDLSSAAKAAEAYREFLRKYPSDPQKDEAKSDLLLAEDMLAQKEKYIADFYLKAGQPKAARTRLERAVQLYPETPTAKAAQKRLEEMNRK